MNENPERQNQPRFTLSRLSRMAPRAGQDAQNAAKTAPDPEDDASTTPTPEMDQTVTGMRLTHRPVQVNPTARSEPPIRLPGRITSQDAVPLQQRGIPIPLAPRPVQPGGKPTVPTNIVPQPVRPSRQDAPQMASTPVSIPPRNQPGATPAGGAQNNGADVHAKPSFDLPPGIQRGLPRPVTPPTRVATQREPVYETLVVKEGQEHEKISPPQPHSQPSQASQAQRPVAPASPAHSAGLKVPSPAVVQVQEPAEQNSALNGSFLLEEILARLDTPPAQTAVVGVCEDGLPVLVDLSDPAPGSILVVSDDEVLRRRLLRTLLHSAALLNSPRNVQFILLTTRPQEWHQWMDGQEITRQCLGIEALPGSRDEPEEMGSPDRWLLKAAGWADQRRSGGLNGPAVLLLVDDLEAAARLEYDARVNFDWLVKEGPAVRIWPVVCLRASAAKEMTRWVRLFKTRLLGPAEDGGTLGQLSGNPDLSLDAAQFAVRVQETWLKFRIPVLPGETR